MSSSRSSLSLSPQSIFDIAVSPITQSATSKRFSGPSVALFGNTDSLSPASTPSPSSLLELSLSPESIKVSPAKICQPPRPPNAFIIYRSEQLKQLREAGTIGGMLQAQVSKLIGGMWRAESGSVREWFTNQAELRKIEHATLYPDYRYMPRKARKPKHAVYHPPALLPAAVVVVKKPAKKLTSTNKGPKPNGNLKTAARSLVSLPLPSMIVPPSPPKISAETPEEKRSVFWKRPALPPPRFLPPLNRSVSDFGPQSARPAHESRQSMGETQRWSDFVGVVSERRARFGGSEYGGEGIATGWTEAKSEQQPWSSSIHVSPTQVVQNPVPRYRLPHEMNTHYLSPQESPYSHSQSSYFDPRSTSTSTSPYSPTATSPYSPTYTPVSPHDVSLLPHQQQYQFLQLPHLEKLEIQQPVPRYDPWNPASATFNPDPWTERHGVVGES